MEQLTAQQLFDKVVNHLRTQKSKSVALAPDGSVKVNPHHPGTICLYRSPDGKKCAAGILITDEEYSPRMEGFAIGQVISQYNLKHLQPHAALIRDLQHTHDQYEVEEWESVLQTIAEQHKLIYTPPTTGKINE